MRLNIEMKCTGRTFEEIHESLTSKWSEFIQDTSAAIPFDSEIFISQPDDDPDSEFYLATLIARAKA